MRPHTTLSGLLALLALGSASSASAVNVVSWDVFSFVNAAPFATPTSHSADTRSDSQAVAAFDNLDSSSSNNSLFYAYDDSANIGFNGEADGPVLKAEMEGSVSSTTPGAFMSETSANVSGTVAAAWSDSLTLAPNLPVGTPLRVDASLVLNGVYSGFAAGSVAANQHFASWSVSVSLQGRGLLDPGNGALGTSLADTQNGTIGGFSFQGGFPELVIPISFTVIGGQSDSFGETLSLGGNAMARTVARGAPGTVTAGFSASFKDTLSWGGISSVTDLTTGLPVLDYTVSSESGFDYSQPASVPEPSLDLLTALGVGALAIRRRSCARLAR